MTFKEAVEGTRNLEISWKPGLQALRAVDRLHIKAENTRNLAGGVDVDQALEHAEPDAHRWDYAIGYRHSDRREECIYWVEIHTASDKEFKVVLAKLSWLKEWLANDGVLLDAFERDFVWVSSGRTSFTLNAPREKVLAQAGLQHKGRVLIIKDTRTG